MEKHCKKIHTDKDTLRARITEQAKQAFCAYGIKAVRMDDIAAAEGISKRTLYELYADKEALLLEVLHAHHQQEHLQMAEVAMKAHNVMGIILLSYQHTAHTLQSVTRLFLEELKFYPKVQAYLEEQRQVGLNAIRRFYQRGVQEGLFQADLNYDIVCVMFREQMISLLRSEACKHFSIAEIYHTEPTAHFPPEPATPAVAPAPASYQSYIPDDSREQYIFYVKELALTQTLIRFGERVVCNVEDENGNEVPLTVAEYIATDLQQDNLQFHNPLHRRILAEAIEHIHDPNFTAERYFVFHADPEVSKLAANLSSDRYQLSKYHSKGQKIVTDEERLADLVPHQMIDFKLSILEEEMKQTLQQLRQPEVAADTNRCLGIMSHYKELSELLKELAKRAGDRVIVKG
jgi:AcrR family transcriptional regulator